MKAEEIVNLFELIKNAPEENWKYNKARLLDILKDFEKAAREDFLLDRRNFTESSVVTEKVIETLQIINETNTLDDILYSPHTRKHFKERLNKQLKSI